MNIISMEVQKIKRIFFKKRKYIIHEENSLDKR